MAVNRVRHCDRSDDATLVGRALAGDRDAYGLLYDRYARLIRAICLDTTRDLSAAQDLCQDVFLRAYERLGGLRRPERFPAWLAAIARMACREWRRGRARDRGRRADVAPNDVPCEGQADAADDEELRLLREAVSRLPEKERLAIHAFYLLDRSLEHARATLDLSRSGMYRVLDRAKRRLRSWLTQHGETRP